MSEPVVIGVDVGATKILVGAVTQRGEIIASRRSQIDSETQATTLRSIDSSISDFLKDWGGPIPHAIGVGLVGQTDPETGTWLEAMNLPIKSPACSPRETIE